MARDVVVIYCSERPKVRGNDHKIENIIGHQYSDTVKPTTIEFPPPFPILGNLMVTAIFPPKLPVTVYGPIDPQLAPLAHP